MVCIPTATPERDKCNGTNSNVKGICEIKMVMKNAESVYGNRRALCPMRRRRNHLREATPGVVKELGTVPLSTVMTCQNCKPANQLLSVFSDVEPTKTAANWDSRTSAAGMHLIRGCLWSHKIVYTSTILCHSCYRCCIKRSDHDLEKTKEDGFGYLSSKVDCQS